MKKIVGTILAAGLALSAFAAEPAANFVMADFTGSADFGWKSDFADSDNVKMGMYNTPSATLKFGFVEAGEKTTTGDGVWGELTIEAGATSIENGKSKLGDKDFDTGKYLNKGADGVVQNTDGVKGDWMFYTPSLFPVPSVKTAKIHLVNGDFSAALNILAPSLEYGEFKAPSATGSTVQTNKIGNMGGNVKDSEGNVISKLSNGFALELAMANLFDFNFKLADNGLSLVKNDGKHIGLAVDASLKAVENLDLTVAGTFNFGKGEEYTGFGVNAGYKLGIGDTLYVKPGIAFTSGKYKAAKNAVNSIEGGVLLGWGAVDQEPGLNYISDKTTEGFSVGVSNNLAEGKIDLSALDIDKIAGAANTTKIVAGLYDQSLLKLLGIEDGLTLKTGLVNETTISNTSVTAGSETVDVSVLSNTFGMGTKFDAKFSPIYISLGGGMKFVNTEAKAKATEGIKTSAETYVKGYNDANKPTSEFAWSAKLGSTEVIDNTDIYVLYEGGYTKNATKDGISKNEISVGTKISF